MIRTIAILTSSALLFACASDPNKKLAEAHHARDNEAREYELRQAILSRAQLEQSAAMDREQYEQFTDQQKKHQKTLAEVDKEEAEARAKLAAERREYLADVDARL